jgi:hypothetical protein
LWNASGGLNNTDGKLKKPRTRAELSELEKRWLYLVRSYEFTERVARTLNRWQEEGGQR